MRFPLARRVRLARHRLTREPRARAWLRSSGDMRRPLDFRQLCAFRARIARPERIELLHEHGFDLAFRPTGIPVVFTHTEMIWH